MICNQCKEKEISNSKLTGEICTSCYFANKKMAEGRIVNSSTLTDTLTFHDGSTIELHKTDDPYIEEDNTLVKLGKPSIDIENNPKHNPDKDKHELPIEGKKYCQSCIERGYGLKLATREWTPQYFICDDCYQPLLDNILGIERLEVERIKPEIKCDSPALNQFYELLNIPEALRFDSSDNVLNHRNDIFNYHATAIVNQNLDEVKENIEKLQVMLFQIKISLEPMQDYINKVKALERSKANLKGVETSRDGIKAPSKVKLSKMEKEAKSLGLSVEKYAEMIKSAKQAEFDKVVGKL